MIKRQVQNGSNVTNMRVWNSINQKANTKSATLRTGGLEKELHGLQVRDPVAVELRSTCYEMSDWHLEWCQQQRITPTSRIWEWRSSGNAAGPRQRIWKRFAIRSAACNDHHDKPYAIELWQCLFDALHGCVVPPGAQPDCCLLLGCNKGLQAR